MKQTTTAILFDLDGTLIDPFNGITKSVQYALHSFGIEEDNLQNLKKFIGPPLSDSFREYYGFSKEKALLAVEKYRELFSTQGLFDCTLYPNVVSTLQTLYSSKITLLLATSKPTVFAQKILDHFSLSHYFSFVAGAELNGIRGKKDEVIAYALAHNNEANPLNCLMVGDRKYDILGAKTHGIPSIGVTYGYAEKNELEEAKPDYYINEFSQLLTLI